ncbi:MAG: alpha-E domain-containing protein [Alphaproteobacteria bacterium]|nr:alpha-E domain-containing protein [Alphaproteobacteria bacterium]
MLSRVADELYWMARYLERAEHSARVMAVKLEAMLDQTPEDAGEAWVRVAAALAWPMTGPVEGQPIEIARLLTLDKAHPSSIITSLRLARDNARQVRELISTEMWGQINRLHLKTNASDVQQQWGAEPVAHLRETADDLLLFAGITDSTMRHGEGWHFIQLGRYIERAQLISRLLDLHFGDMPDDVPQKVRAPRYFEWITLLKQCTAFEAYCKVYTADVQPAKIAEFLIFDPEFPHSIRFAVDRVQEELGHLGAGGSSARRLQAERLAGRMKAGLDYGQVDELMAGDIDGFLRAIQASCKQIHQAVFDAYVGYSVDELMPG